MQIKSQLISIFCAKLALLCCLYSNVLCADTLPNLSTADLTQISHRTYLIYRRFYTIQRLEKIMNMFHTMNNTKKLRPFNMNTIATHSLLMPHNNKQPKAGHLNDLRPLFNEWDDFIAYRSLDDVVFVERLSKEIYIISVDFLSQFNPIGNQKKVDMLPFQKNIKRKNLSNDHYDISYIATADEIAERFYCIERIKPAIRILEQLAPTTTGLKKDAVFEDTIEFASENVRACVDAIENQKSIAPLIKEWHKFKQYRLINDSTYARELFLCIFIALKNILFSLYEPRSATDKAYASGYAAIQDFDEEEILYEIDLLTRELPYLINAPTKPIFSFPIPNTSTLVAFGAGAAIASLAYSLTR